MADRDWADDEAIAVWVRIAGVPADGVLTGPGTCADAIASALRAARERGAREEREACAEIVEGAPSHGLGGIMATRAAAMLADAIRARSTHEPDCAAGTDPRTNTTESHD